MQKLKLIIPLLKSPSSIFLKFISTTLFLMGAQKLSAQSDGCHVVRGITDVIYYNPYGSQWITTGVVDASGAEGGYHTDGSATFGCIKDLGGSCDIYQQYKMADGTTGIRIYMSGTYANIDPLNCPIDDYLPLFFIFTASFTFLKLKQERILLNENNLNHSCI
ncbi:hypothetical protein ACFOG5_10545 [Pedobacter fastidiosus]|uniref:Uncharacterized protein n=1 Tax=Pedobacter fastidiosus TaxID=2765361 RepID=A0ABR7KVQ4_9SPHI|nr:hypothetical protein [Pedobacter fastidiosus]MBC6112196.1 hypothetical protein [Pedobacter fastidiosus]